MIMKSWWHIIVTCSLIAVRSDGSLTWAGQGEDFLLFAQRVIGHSAVQGGRRVQSEETPIPSILRHKGELDLSAEQSEELETIDARLEGLIGSLRPRIVEVINELMALVQADRVDMVTAEAKIRAYAALEVQLSIEKLSAIESAKAVLRPEQLAKLKALPLDDGGKAIVTPGRQRGI